MHQQKGRDNLYKLLINKMINKKIMKTIVTTTRKSKNENYYTKVNYPVITFDSKTKAKKWLKELKEVENDVIGSTKLYNNNETLVTEGKFSIFVRTIWSEKEYNKLKAIKKDF